MLFYNNPRLKIYNQLFPTNRTNLLYQPFYKIVIRLCLMTAVSLHEHFVLLSKNFRQTKLTLIIFGICIQIVSSKQTVGKRKPPNFISLGSFLLIYFLYKYFTYLFISLSLICLTVPNCFSNIISHKSKHFPAICLSILLSKIFFNRNIVLITKLEILSNRNRSLQVTKLKGSPSSLKSKQAQVLLLQ